MLLKMNTYIDYNNPCTCMHPSVRVALRCASGSVRVDAWIPETRVEHCCWIPVGSFVCARCSVDTPLGADVDVAYATRNMELNGEELGHPGFVCTDCIDRLAEEGKISGTPLAGNVRISGLRRTLPCKACSAAKTLLAAYGRFCVRRDIHVFALPLPRSESCRAVAELEVD